MCFGSACRLTTSAANHRESCNLSGDLARILITNFMEENRMAVSKTGHAAGEQRAADMPKQEPTQLPQPWPAAPASIPGSAARQSALGENPRPTGAEGQFTSSETNLNNFLVEMKRI